MATKKSKQEPERKEATFPGPAGITTIPIYEGMSDDLPPLWQVRLGDAIAAYSRGEYGDSEFAIRLAAIFTHLPDVPANQRLDPKLLDRLGLSQDAVRGLLSAGADIMPALLPKASTDAQDEPESDTKNG